MDSDIEVVLSGIGGRFPSSRNIEQLAANLMKNKDLIRLDETRWSKDNKSGAKPTIGVVDGIGDFDNSYFGYLAKLSKWTNPLTKLSIERAFEAMIDAGLSPVALRGSSTHVYCSYSISSFESLFMEIGANVSKYTIMGQARTMCANRISYFLDLKGQSCAYDGSWSWGQLGLQLALRAIRRGECNAALVMSGNVVDFPEVNQMVGNFGLMSNDGLCRSFDEIASGGQRSDGCVCFLVQRADQAKRVYARILDSRCEYLGPRPYLDPVLCPSPSSMESMLREAYESCGQDPRNVIYLEADGSGCKLREEVELQAADAVLCRGRNRDKPLLIGSVKSNMGATDGCSGMMAVAKLAVAMEHSTIPANLHFVHPNTEINALVEGRMKVVTKNTPITLSENTLMAATTFGFAGTVGHAILKPNTKEKKPVDVSKELPRLVVLSGRTEDGTSAVLQKIQETPFDPEFLRLTHDVFTDEFRGFEYRGYTIVPKSANIGNKIMKYERRTIWFLYSGMGSQWAGMGNQLMQFPIFAQTIERLQNVLILRGIDLKTIITETGPTAFDCIMKSFVGITAIQIALTNMLHALNIKPDGLVGHSLGELGCAYADGCLTEEQTILVAYARGKASTEAELIKGTMAAVGLGYHEIKDVLPPTIDVACRNSSTSCTLSGPTEDVEKYVEKLTADGVFARSVNVSNIAFHSRYIKPAAPFLYKYLREVITNPKPRSSHWISTSVPQDQWDTDNATLCSVEYQTNNLLSPVYFEDALSFIPSQAVVIEIAPHGLLQAILKRALPENTHIPLTHRTAPSGVHFFLQAVGELYLQGFSPKISSLYPPVQFPVSRGTPSLAGLTSWDHSEPTPNLELPNQPFYCEEITPDTPWLKMQESPVIPISRMLTLAWAGFANVKRKKMGNVPVIFKEVRVHKTLHVPVNCNIRIHTSHSPGTGIFEMINDMDEKLMTGRIYELKEDEQYSPNIELSNNNGIILNSRDIYDDLRAKGLMYDPSLKSIGDIGLDGTVWSATVKNYGVCSMLEAMVQVILFDLLEKRESIGYTKTIRRIEINPYQIPSNKGYPITFDSRTNIAYGQGICIQGMKFDKLRSKEEITEVALQQLESIKIHKLCTNSLDVTLSLKDQIEESHLDYVGTTSSKMRVMGIARKTKSGKLQADPLMSWDVPTSWTDQDAATVPFAYSTAIYALSVLCKTQKGESILIHEGLSAIGQAAIRVSLHLQCEPVFVTVANEAQKESLLKLFPKVNRDNVFFEDLSFEWNIKLRTKGEGVRVILGRLPGQKVSATISCMALNGRQVFYGRESMLDGSTFGTIRFLKSISLYGLSGDYLFRASLHDQHIVVNEVRSGLRSGVIKPLIGPTSFTSASSSYLHQNGNKNKASKLLLNLNEPGTEIVKYCNQDETYAIIGGSDAEWLQIAGWLAMHGALNITAAPISNKVGSLVKHRIKALKRQFGANIYLKDKTSSQTSPQYESKEKVDVIIIFEEEKRSIIKEYRESLTKSTAALLVLQTSVSHDNSVLNELCETRRKAGLRTTVLKGPVFRATALIPKFLGGTLPPYIDFLKHSEKDTHDELFKSLPSSAKALSELSNAFPTKPRVQELPVKGLRLQHSHEVFPIFVLPPLGVLQPSEKDALKSFALKQHQPVILVELPEGGTIHQRAKTVVDEIHSLRPTGPYNVMGWALSTPLALQVARDLEAEGHKSVTFLIDGDVQRVKEWASTRVAGNVGESTFLLDVLKDDTLGLSLDKLSSTNSWSERLSLAMSALNPQDLLLKFKVEKGLTAVFSYLKVLSEHTPVVSEPLESQIRVVRRSTTEPTCFPPTNANVSFTTISQLTIDSIQLANTINEASAWSRLANEQEIRKVVLEKPHVPISSAFCKTS